LQEIKSRSLTCEHGPSRTRYFEQRLICGHAIAVVCMPGEADTGVELAERLYHPLLARQNGGFAGDYFSADVLVGWHQLGGYVT
jgi:hypothetical protein